MLSEEVTILKIVAFKAFPYNVMYWSNDTMLCMLQCYVMYKSIHLITALELISQLEGMMGVIEVAT